MFPWEDRVELASSVDVWVDLKLQRFERTCTADGMGCSDWEEVPLELPEDFAHGARDPRILPAAKLLWRDGDIIPLLQPRAREPIDAEFVETEGGTELELHLEYNYARWSCLEYKRPPRQWECCRGATAYGTEPWLDLRGKVTKDCAVLTDEVTTIAHDVESGISTQALHVAVSL